MEAYKYRNGVKCDLESLANNYFWAPKPDQLNDPKEACVNEENLNNSLRALKDTKINSAYNHISKTRCNAGIYSLSRSPLDITMWAHYGNSHKGFCIEYDLKKLMFEAREGWDFIEVKYQSKPQTIGFEDFQPQKNKESNTLLTKMMGTKSCTWAQEEEFKIITASSRKNYFNPDAVTGIYFGFQCEAKFIIDVQKQLSSRNISYKQLESVPNSICYGYKEYSI